MLNITDLDDEDNNNGSNDYTPVEVPMTKKEERKPDIDIEQLLMSERPMKKEEFFEEEDN